MDRIFTEMTKARVGALTMLPSAPLSQQCNRLADLAAKNRLPALYISMRECVTGGGLMSYGANSQDLYSRMATYVDKILKGAQAGNLPVEQPTKFELAINLKTAKALGLTIPPSLLARADRGYRMMVRRTFLVTAAGFLAAPLAVEAQKAGKVHRIGVLSLDSLPPGLFEAFTERLRELGYVEGKNIAIESRHAGGRPSDSPL